jgi:hypothetical protein
MDRLSERGKVLRRPLAGILALIAASAPGLAACSHGTKQADADRVQASIPSTAGKVIAGVYSLALQSNKVGGNRQGLFKGGTLASAGFLAEPAHRRAALVVTGADNSLSPILLSANRSLYARRITTSARERRPWIRVDLSRVSDTNKPTFRELMEQVGPGDATLVNPQLLLDLLSGGVLAGSIHRTPHANGTNTYRFNVSVDKANRELKLDDDLRKDRTKLLKSIAVTGDIHKATAVLRRDGTLASFRVVLDEQPDKQASLGLTATLVTTKYIGSVKTLALPSSNATVRVQSIGDVRTAVGDQIKAWFVAQAQHQTAAQQ